MKIRTGRTLICSGDHVIGTMSINTGTHACITGVGRKCTLKIGKREYEVSEKVVNNYWNIDVVNQLKTIGMPDVYIKKAEMIGYFALEYFLKVDASGLNQSDFINEMKILIDDSIMNLALK